jgi:hypothetical protein
MFFATGFGRSTWAHGWGPCVAAAALPLPCPLLAMQDGTAHVVRFRSRHNPGRPNWARILYMDHEDDVFSRQPNLLCNFFHWIDSPEKRWPEKFWGCGPGAVVDTTADRSKVFYCSKAYYCNWTNNPFLISKSWWYTEYVQHFPHFKVGG